MEKSLIDKSDPKFVTPRIRESYPPQMQGFPIPYYDPDFPQDVKLETRKQVGEQMEKMMGCDGGLMQGWERITIEGGCPEEEDQPALIMEIKIPEGKKKKKPVVFSVCGGGLVYCSPIMFQTYSNYFADEMGAISVLPVYRTCIDAPYPAAVNDLHAAYKWVVEHADEIGADPENIVLFGTSSGAHLALALAFRLKRYGYRPRGCVADNPITDFRPNKSSSRYYISDGEWSGENVRDNALMYLGKENICSPFLGPEAYANLATVEDCAGLCPMYIATRNIDVDVQYNLEFVNKLLEAGVPVDYHIINGTSHGMGAYAATDENVAELYRLINEELFNDVRELITYDLRVK